MEKITALMRQYRSMIIYLVLGCMTTAVNMAVYYVCYEVWEMGSDLSTVLAWIFAVAFAFLTNKPWAFDSHDWSLKTVLPEAGRFLECRVGTGLIELAMMHIFVEVLGLAGGSHEAPGECHCGGAELCGKPAAGISEPEVNLSI